MLPYLIFTPYGILLIVLDRFSVINTPDSLDTAFKPILNFTNFWLPNTASRMTWVHNIKLPQNTDHISSNNQCWDSPLLLEHRQLVWPLLTPLSIAMWRTLRRHFGVGILIVNSKKHLYYGDLLGRENWSSLKAWKGCLLSFVVLWIKQSKWISNYVISLGVGLLIVN